jgi:hypothetical protein
MEYFIEPEMMNGRIIGIEEKEDYKKELIRSKYV